MFYPCGDYFKQMYLIIYKTKKFNQINDRTFLKVGKLITFCKKDIPLNPFSIAIPMHKGEFVSTPFVNETFVYGSIN